MKHRLDFENLIDYDADKSGITVHTTLKFSDTSVSFPSKIDTGSSFCIFERKYGVKLGLEIEQGLYQRVGTANGSFTAFGFRLTLQVEEL